METRHESIQSDELLAIRCQLGEATAWDALVLRWHTPLWRYVRRLTGDDVAADETLQDIWLKILRAIPGLRDPSRLRPWLFGIARRTVMDRLRQRYSEPDFAPLELADLTESQDISDSTFVFEDVHAALDRLPAQEREALVLLYLRELTLAEMADVLGTPIGTVKSRLFRARQSLRRELTTERES